MLAVPDGAIAGVAAQLPPDALALHTSGAADLGPLGPRPHAALLHPLMTFPGPEVAQPDLRGVAARIAGSSERALGVARTLAASLGLVPLEVPGDPRLYHAAAVLAGNLATVLLAEAGATLAAAGVPPEEARRALLPLALRSLQNAVADPVAALTGPAARGDHATLAAHRAALDAAGLEGPRATYDQLTARALALLGSVRSA
ncbi:MAG: DUF2520 domain-containing protein [Alphaproteobacteria bacterium]|nr:DUF2520 domain-containing protein [Alphaproteobacteria bacterium]